MLKTRRKTFPPDYSNDGKGIKRQNQMKGLFRPTLAYHERYGRRYDERDVLLDTNPIQILLVALNHHQFLVLGKLS